MTPEEQIDWTIASLQATVSLKGWPNSRRLDLTALIQQLAHQWDAYKAGTLTATDPMADI
jgi:hypothetical protein